MNRARRTSLAIAALLLPVWASAAPSNQRVGDVLAADTSLAAFNTCYATLGNTTPNGGALIRIDLATGSGTLIGPTGIVGQLGDAGVPALAIRSTGEMYAMSIGPAARLYRLNAATGAATLVGATSLASPPAMVFDGSDVLNVVDAAGRLYRVNEQTAAATLVGTTGVALKGLAVDPTDGWLWGTDASSRVYMVDGQTAAVMLIGITGFSPSPDLCFDQDGVLFASSGGGLGTNNLISIDKTTGSGTLIGPIGFSSVSGMAMRFDHIVPTLVQAYDARWTGIHVELRWRLADGARDIGFTIDRTAGAGEYRRMDAAGVSWDGAGFVFVDASVEPGWTYLYRVAVLKEGAPFTSFETSVTVPATAFELEQNQPNPFHAGTTIRFVTREAAHTSLTVHDVSGRLMRVLADGVMGPGSHAHRWDRRDEGGAVVRSGVYFYRLKSGDRVLTRKMLLLD